MKIRFEGGEQRDPARVDGISVPYAPARRAAARWRWYVVVLLAASPLLFFLGKNLFEAAVIEAPAEVILNMSGVNAPLPGLIVTVEVKPGDIVKEGQRVASLVDYQIRERGVLVEKELAAIKGGDIAPLEDALSLARSVERRMAEYLGKMRRLMALGSATRAEVAEAEGRLDAARKDVILARNAIEDMRTRSARLSGEFAAIQKLETGIALVAPIAGRVIDVAGTPGEYVAQGSTVLSVAQNDFSRIVAYVRAGDMKRISEDVRVNAHFADGASFPCRVEMLLSMTRKSPTAPVSTGDTPGERRVPVVLEPLQPLPPSYARQGLPCTIYFGMRSFF